MTSDIEISTPKFFLTSLMVRSPDHTPTHRCYTQTHTHTPAVETIDTKVDVCAFSSLLS